MSKRLLICGLFVVVLAACQQQQQVLPTVQSLPEATTAAPPTATEVVQPTATATVRVRPTFPPTFTPTPTYTETPTSTSTPLPTETPFNVPAIPPGCETFLVNDNSRSIQFKLGETPVVGWSAATGAVRYRIKLVEANGPIIRDDIYIAETSYIFAADLFQRGKYYGWEVYPINEAGDQMCFAQGGELLPYVPPGQ